MNIRAYNSNAWDNEVEKGNTWTQPVGPEVIAAARRGEWSIVLTEIKPIPRSWFPELNGCEILCLASGGGQQGPTLAAAGGNVTVLDNSPRQLAQDRMVAERDGLPLATVEGDMADLSMFADASFDLIIHPVSNLFAPEILPVWREAFRVLRPGGYLLAGFHNPMEYIFDAVQAEKGIFVVRHSLPYSDLTCMTEAERIEAFGPGSPLEFSHTLEEQIGGQLDAGFHLIGMYEDYRRTHPMKNHMPSYIATRALKPRSVPGS